MEKLDPKILMDLIKEDRNEIRNIKNRMYTTIQTLAAVSFAIATFFIERCTHDGAMNTESWADARRIIIWTNAAFCLLSWAIFFVMNTDLYYVRRCLMWRESQLTQSTEKNYFGTMPTSSRKSWYLRFLAKIWPTKFENDGLVFLMMILLTAVYIGVTATVCWAI